MNTKRLIPFLLAAGLLSGVAPARAEHAAWLIGLVNLADYKAALLEMTNSPPDAAFAMDTHRWVVEGQSIDDLNLQENHRPIEIMQIDFTNVVVRAKEKNVEILYPPKQTNFVGNVTGKTLCLDQAAFDDTLDFYAEVKGRTLLVHPGANHSAFTISATVPNRGEAARLVEGALQAKGLTTIADGERFEWIIPTRLTNTLSPGARRPRLPSPGQPSTNAVDTLPRASINFVNSPLPEALAAYQTLDGRKWVQDKPLPATITLTFHNQTPLTKTETLHAFDVLLNWQGLKVLNREDQSFKLVPADAGE